MAARPRHRLPRPPALAAGLLMAPLLALLIALSSVSAALPGYAWPVQSLGNRGADVRAVQSLLLGHGVAAAYDGVFTTETHASVVAFQGSRGLPQTGVVDGATWAELVVPVGPGAAREPVLTLQRQLNEKHRAGLAVSGAWNAATETAVRAFERHMGLPVDGVADPVAWRHLVAHYDLPRFSRAGLCDYSAGVRDANWGTASAIGQIEAAGARMASSGYGRVAVGNVSLQHGGDIRGHITHEVGLDVDVRPIRDRRDQCRLGTSFRLASYDRTATRVLIRAIQATAPGHVKLIYFNDPKLIREGLTTRYPGHDDHLHIRYCELEHADPRYRC